MRKDLLLSGADSPDQAQPAPRSGWRTWRPWLLVAIAAMGWWIVYTNLLALTEWITFDLLGLSPASALGMALAFFLYDVPKILLLLTGMIFVVTTIRTFFSAERTRQLLGGRRAGVGNVLAAGLGVVTPFCSCSAVPLFIGFIEAGVPLGVTFSFLIAAPMINEVALAMLFGMFGWRIALLYMGTGLIIASLAGMTIGRVPRIENGVEDFVWQMSVGGSAAAGARMTWAERFAVAWQSTREIVGKVWLYVVISIMIGAFIHGYAPEDALAGIMGEDAWWSVPAAVAIGVPMYANAAGVIPVVEALIGKGAALGTALAFMMSVVALSLPEMIILRRVLKLRLIILFVAIVALGIMLTGYLFNFIL
ncbi:MAG: permease [Caldilineaceae bacterium]|nr:permease [Caldilineaceae bacterium]